MSSVADPGFLRHQTQMGGGALTYYFIIWHNFFRKMHENEKKVDWELGEGGGGAPSDKEIKCIYLTSISAILCWLSSTSSLVTSYPGMSEM